MTIGEIYRYAMRIKSQAQADRFFNLLLLRHLKLFRQTRDEAISIIKSNLGYYAGYYDEKTMRGINKLFKKEIYLSL